MSVKVDGTNGLLQNYDYQVPITGFSYTFTSYNVLVMNPLATLATGTITMPASPVDGMTVSFSSTKQITALTVNANTGQTINGAPTSLVANGSATFIYRLSSTSWFPVASANSSPAFSGIGGQVFTSSGTFTVPAGVTAVKVSLCGGGGNGANVGGGGGGGAGVAIKYVTGLTPGGTVTVTVGNATQTSSFGAYCSATGGGNGGGSGVLGTGGSGSGGDLNYTATNGPGASYTVSGAAGWGVRNAYGGVPGMFGGVSAGNSDYGFSPSGYGNGGGGGGCGSGGAGSKGIVIVEW